MKNISLQQSMTRYNFLTRPSLIYANQINFPYSNNFSSRSHYCHKKKVEVDKISSPRAQNSINSWVDTSLHRVEGHANNKRKSKQHFSSSFLEMYFSDVASLLKFKWKKIPLRFTSACSRCVTSIKMYQRDRQTEKID